ncbi:MAG: oligosaccharide flippase family protein [Rhodobacteraceae bacterium]|nr:oligosaccharide flippase family protein [Paracoccaceae bacterium]
MLKKAFMLVSGDAFGSALLLLRNLIVARLVSPEDYGIASTFAVAMSIVEMLSYLGLNLMIVVDKDGDAPQMQKVLQGFQVLRGVMSSAVLFAISVPYARFLGIEHVAWAFQVIAAIPFINSLQHFDMHRLKRHAIFRPWIVTQAIPPLIAVLVLWPLALMYGDYRIMLVSLIVQAVATVVLSHVMAERPYRLSWDFPLVRRATFFGWPLLLNGALLFGVFNGERLIVGRELGMAPLAVFSMAMTLTLTPTLVFDRQIQSLFLPRLSALRENDAQFQRMGAAYIEAGLAIGMVLLIGTVLVGGPVVTVLLGPKYAGMLALLVPMAAVQAVRVAKTGPSNVSLAKEKPGIAPISNAIRVLSLPIAWAALIRTGDIMVVLGIAFAVEALAYLVSLWLTGRRAGLRLGPLVLPSALAAAASGGAFLESLWSPQVADLLGNLGWTRWAVVALCLATLGSMTALRGYIFKRFAP